MIENLNNIKKSDRKIQTTYIILLVYNIVQIQ